MSNAIQTTGEAMPAINRRRMLLGLAAASSSVPAVAIAKSQMELPGSDEIKENQELVDAWANHRKAETEYHAAKDALSWLADEWRHLWPLAPEEILGGANAHTYNRHDANIERDIIGRPMMRDVVVLTKRLSKEFRAKGGTTCFSIDQPDELAAQLANVRNRSPKGRTARSLDKSRKEHQRIVESMETRLRLATSYHAETRRLLEVAGVDAAKERIKTAEENLEAAAVTVSKLPSRTLVGLRLKADILLYSLEKWKVPRNDGFIFGAIWRLTEDALEATQHLNGKRSAAPLPTAEGGEA